MAEGIAFSIVGSIVGKFAEYTVNPVLRQIKYLFFYNSNMKNLQNKVGKLESEITELTKRVESARKNDESIRNDVLLWIQKGNNLKSEADDLGKSKSGSETSCPFNRCLNLISRYKLSRSASKKTIEADELLRDKFERVSHRLRQPVQELKPPPREDFETRLSTKKKIKEALKEKDTRIIGICGMPGVGKTTLAREICSDAEVKKLFEDVAFAVVSKDPDTKKIQDQLAEMLGLKFDENTISGRAGRLRHRLESEDRNGILVILDDVWKEINLEDIGIPSPHDRLKIMFTTRIKDTCSELGAQKEFEIKVLNQREGWKLFVNTTGISNNETDVELMSIANKVARKCRGLPLALVSVGKALKSNKAAHKWRDTLRQLQSSATNLEGMDNIVYKNIRLSYKYLVSNEERDLLLLCSLFAEDESILIEDLVRYARGLDLFQHTKTLYQTRDRAKTIVDNLKGCYLLQQDKQDEVKLHVVIRDFCVQMAYEDERGYLVKHGLKEWPEHDADESYSAISITFDELDQLPSGLKYRNVKLLRVICPKLGECNISEEFFNDMKELRVLELKGMYIQSPSSIQLLTGLRTLSLIDCKIHSQLSMIGSLKKLEILSFYHSSLNDNSPIELANLSNIRSLDLRLKKTYCPLRPGVLSGMKKLEVLCLGRYIPIEGEDTKILKNVVSELDENGFINLQTLILSSGDFEYLIDATNSIPNGTFGKLESLELEELPKLIELCNGNLDIKPQLFCNLMTVRMNGCHKIRSLFRESVANGLVNLQSLDISFCEMLEEVVSTDARENEVTKMPEFPKLKEVSLEGLRRFKSFTSQSNSGVAHQTLFNQTLILSSGDFEYLIDATNSIPNGTFGKLESLQLEELPKLIELCNGNLDIKPQLFCNLMTVRMNGCHKIRSLFRESVANGLANLQSLNIYKCLMLQEVVSTDARENEVTKMLVFPKLKEVNLKRLSRFKSFTSQSNGGVAHQTLFNQVNFPNMEELHVDGLDCIVKLLGKETPITTSVPKLTDVSLRHCHALEVLFDFEGIKVTNDDAEINMLGQLTSLTLEALPKLVHITRMVPKGIRVFQNLKNLDVVACKSLRYLFSPSMANSLVALKDLMVLDCESIKAIVGKEEEEEEEGTSEIKRVEAMTTRIEFPKLDHLKLWGMPSIQMFCSQNCDLVFPLLKDQTIEYCPMMPELSPWPVSAPKLSKDTRERYKDWFRPLEEEYSKKKTQLKDLKFLISWAKTK